MIPLSFFKRATAWSSSSSRIGIRLALKSLGQNAEPDADHCGVGCFIYSSLDQVEFEQKIAGGAFGIVEQGGVKLGEHFVGGFHWVLIGVWRLASHSGSTWPSGVG